MIMQPDNFKQRIEYYIALVPQGKVVTYGDLAALAGQAHAARVVGGIAHFGNPELPWHRLVNRFGGLASGFHGGREAQAQLLLQEGITCTNFVVDDFGVLRWRFLYEQ